MDTIIEGTHTFQNTDITYILLNSKLSSIEFYRKYREPEMKSGKVLYSKKSPLSYEVKNMGILSEEQVNAIIRKLKEKKAIKNCP